MEASESLPRGGVHGIMKVGWSDKKKYSRGFLRYSPLATNASALTNELALVLTSGRLSSASRKEISQTKFRWLPV